MAEASRRVGKGIVELMIFGSFGSGNPTLIYMCVCLGVRCRGASECVRVDSFTVRFYFIYLTLRGFAVLWEGSWTAE